eukprot:TRINITY_DN11912_c0_g1_i1.p1 TRINITY_DN11912_c0_g1~~TRINITY_DN11912_c0_g1_i1.p1  ORF type:complete len:326 (-),score=79.40 TRINITY_DN11912_c0_g1_i1:25-1002(-)
MKAALLVIFLVATVLSLSVINEEVPAITQETIDKINSLNVNWIAGTQERTVLHGATIKQAKTLLGAKLGGPKLPRKTFDSVSAVPAQFDARTNWPQCSTMRAIRDQSACGSCWAFGAAEAISDRYCIFLNKNLSVSAADIAFCCGFDCGDGCGGGYPSSAWQYWVQTGAVDEACDPYPFPSCDHHLPNSKNPCPSNEYPNPSCPSSCKNTENWSAAKHHGSTSYSLSGEADIQQEIYKNGPVETAFEVYEDFLSYKSGVYKHVSGGFLGGHAVKFLGWGVENGEKYWLVANSWNPDWGDNGYFKILRGVNECGIEGEVNGGVPKD